MAHLVTGFGTVAGRNLARDVRTVTLRTHAGDPDELRRWAGRMGARYLGADDEARLAELNGGPGKHLVRLVIERAAGAHDIG